MRFVLLLMVIISLLECTHGLWFSRRRPKTTPKPKPTCIIPKKCDVQLMFLEKSQHCVFQRKKEIGIARHWYKITDDSKPSTIKFPLRHIPWLNQTVANVKYFYAIDDFEAGYLMTLSAWLGAATKVSAAIDARFEKLPYRTLQEFSGLSNAWNTGVKTLKAPHLFGNPTMYPDFTDQINTNEWISDQAFVQRRLAGQCPYTLRKVTIDGHVGISVNALVNVMNTELLKFQFDIGGNKLSFEKVIEDGRLFVHYLEDMDDMVAAPDLTPEAGKKMRPLVSPISFYYLDSDGLLKVFAIQIDSQQSAKVYTPKSGLDEWMKAKQQVDLAHDHWCQSYVHLGEIHFVNTVFCLTFRRHLSEKHPLYDLFKFHCEGTVVHISTTYTVLASEDSSGNIFFTMGAKGFIKLSDKAFNERYYGKFDYDNLISKRGLDDKRIKYYPFRDDAVLILAEYRKFAKSLTNLYYSGFWNEDFTKHDVELQSWANELSADGKNPPDGGNGKFPGFPASIANQRLLEQIIVRFLWVNVLHTTCNYALAPDFLPTKPGKLYEAAPGEEALSYLQAYPNGKLSAAFTGARGRLCNFRVNRIFDYYDKVKDSKYGELVRQTHDRLHGCVQQTLAKRNAERKTKRQLGYQYIEPKWMTNSVHI